MSWEMRQGDCLSLLAAIPDGSVQCCVTSPPYWGLRDYGTAAWEGGDAGCDHAPEARGGRFASPVSAKQARNTGSGTASRRDCRCGARRIDSQLGLEPTPELYVASMVQVFREVRRVLRDDGTLWLNLGDSYATGAGKVGERPGGGAQGDAWAERGAMTSPNRMPIPGLKPKDLVGIPWRIAFALQQPYYTGRIRDERDRIWLAAMLDAEGCLFIHKRKAGQHNGQGYYRQNDNFGPGVEISNTSRAVVERILALVGQGSICSQGPDENARRKQTIYRWNLRTIECRAFVQELYPYLVAKRQQARILIGCPPSGARAEAAHAALISLHRTGASDVDFPAPASMLEPGWWLRSDVIWSKCNPMPESVTDRPTKAHEYLFLLAKAESYYYDAQAIAEPSAYGPRSCPPGNGNLTDPIDSVNDRHSRPRRVIEVGTSRNRRTVWTIATQPFAEAHFATFPQALVEPCILAGTKPADTVLDPFAGSGTVGVVALRHGRRFLGLELNPGYVDMAKRRIAGPLFAEL